MIRKKERVYLYELMGLFMKEISTRIKFREMELINGKIIGVIKGNGRMEKCMVKVNLYGQMEGNM